MLLAFIYQFIFWKSAINDIPTGYSLLLVGFLQSLLVGLPESLLVGFALPLAAKFIIIADFSFLSRLLAFTCRLNFKQSLYFFR